MSRWFRHYAGMARDDKLVRASLAAKQPVERVLWVWSAILESAAEIDDGGRYEIDHAEMGRFLRVDPGKLVAIEDALRSLGRVASGVVVKWGDRQFKSDRSAERQRRYRERQSSTNDDPSPSSPNVSVTSPSRQRDAPEAETETDTRTPTVAQPTSPASPPAAAPRSRVDYDRIEAQCREAAGLTNAISPSLNNLAPIFAFLDKGYDLERDILPVLRAKRAAGVEGRSWGYYRAAIEDSVKAAAGVAPRPAAPAKLSREDEWRQRLGFLVDTGQWLESVWGPPPGSQFCEIPDDFIAKHRPELASRYRREDAA